MSDPSSRSPCARSTPPPELLSARERALQPQAARNLFLHRVLSAERRCRGILRPGPEKKPLVKPDEADGVLAALAERYAPGDPLTIGQAHRETGYSVGRLLAVRRWARLTDRWPYAEFPSQCRTADGGET